MTYGIKKHLYLQPPFSPMKFITKIRESQYLFFFFCMEPWAVAKKWIMLVQQCQQPLVPNVMSVTSVDKGDNEMKPGVVHKSPIIYLTAEEKPGKPQLGAV